MNDSIHLKVSVLCQNCGSPCPYSPPDGENPWGVWHWHDPCPRCGANKWAAHDVAGAIRRKEPREEE